MKAVFNSSAKTKYTTSHRKEGKCCFESFAAAIPSKYGIEANCVVDLRIYYTGVTACACIWVNADGVHTQGSGSAGGYGYHKSSAAAAYAILNAGFELSEPIDGRGTESITAAVKAISEAIGHPEALIIRSHQ